MDRVVISAEGFPRNKKVVRGRRIVPALLILQALVAAGCGSGVSNQTAPVAAPPSTTPTVSGPQSYFESAVEGPISGTQGITQQLATFSIDDTKQTFAQTTYGFGPLQSGPQLNYSGSFTKLPRGLLDLSTDFYYATYGLNSCDQANCDTYPSPPVGGYAVELAGQAGGLVQLDGLPFTPLAAAETCPTSMTPVEYQFVTIPAAVADPSAGTPFSWDPVLDTAYGSVSVSTAGGSVLFSNIEQFTAAGTQIINYSTIAGAPVAFTSISGDCSPTFYGNTISVPGSITITSTPTTQTLGVSATVGIGPTNLLVESNGNVQGSTASTNFQPFLGAGSGAIGVPKPASPVTPSDLAAAQYLGFIYNSGTAPSSATSWTSTLGSFGGFPASLPASCAAVTDQTGTQSNPLFGGDFPNNDATMTGDAGVATFGNCDVSIYLNAQDPANNGLFPNATVAFGPNFSGNGAGMSLTAVAIAGQLNNKFAIFLISSTGEGIYLLQSN